MENNLLGKTTKSLHSHGPALPIEILRMDGKAIKLYKTALEEGEEVDHSIRIMIIGHFGVGKTTLARRLLGEPVDIQARDGTNEIDVHIFRCKVSSSDLTWLLLQPDEKSKTARKRLAKVIANRSTGEEDAPTPAVEEILETTAAKTESSVGAVGGAKQIVDVQGDEMLNSGEKLETQKEEEDEDTVSFKEMKALVESGTMDLGEFASVSLWDFAGQYVFYTTHQMFLSPTAVYLLVTDISKHIGDVVMEDECYFDSSGPKQCTISGDEMLNSGEKLETQKEEEDEDTVSFKEMKALVESGTMDLGEFASVSLWDFAGQYVFYTTHQMFLSPTAVYLLVTDISKHIGDVVMEDECYFDSSGPKQCTISGDEMLNSGEKLETQKEEEDEDTASFKEMKALVESGTMDLGEFASISLWDSAGQYVFYTTHQMFLSPTAVYLLVTDISKHIGDVVMEDECYFDSSGPKQCTISGDEMLNSGEKLETQKEEEDEDTASFKEMKALVESGTMDLGEFASVSLWDFAGQYVFYTTHQMFLSPRAVYLLVTDISKHIGDVVMEDECYFDSSGPKECTISDFRDFWLNWIHTCSSDDPCDESKVPPVILVGTHADKLTKPTVTDDGDSCQMEENCNRDKRASAYFEAVRNHLREKTTQFHLADEDFDIPVDNTVNDSKLNDLKKKIVEVAQRQPHWGTRIPAKWLPLEAALYGLKEKIVDFVRIEKLNDAMSVPISTAEELELFIQFHHQSGNILYFSEGSLKEKVVLDPQWLVNALKSLITANMFYSKNPHVMKKWREFSRNGILQPQLLDAVWQKEKNPSFHDNRAHLLALMEKLKLISRPMLWHKDDATPTTKEYHLAPCMLKEKPPEVILSPCQGEDCETTSILVFFFKRKFLSPAIFHHLLAACLSKWPLWRQGERDRIFCGCGVFKIDQLHKLTLFFRDFTIQAFVTKFGRLEKSPREETCIDVLDFLDNSLTFFTGCIASSSLYKLWIKCQENKSNSVNAIIPVSKLQEEKEVVCSCHDSTDTHVINSVDMLKYWFPCKPDSVTAPFDTGYIPGVHNSVESMRMELLYERIDAIMDPLLSAPNRSLEKYSTLAFMPRLSKCQPFCERATLLMLVTFLMCKSEEDVDREMSKGSNIDLSTDCASSDYVESILAEIQRSLSMPRIFLELLVEQEVATGIMMEELKFIIPKHTEEQYQLEKHYQMCFKRIEKTSLKPKLFSDFNMMENYEHLLSPSFENDVTNPPYVPAKMLLGSERIQGPLSPSIDTQKDEGYTYHLKLMENEDLSEDTETVGDLITGHSICLQDNEQESTLMPRTEIENVEELDRKVALNRRTMATEGLKPHVSQIRDNTWIPLEDLPKPTLDDVIVAPNPDSRIDMSLEEIFESIGQRLVPGPKTTMRYEFLRLCTMKTFPSINKPFIIRLVATGFYYASVSDELTCYCCGIRNSNWRATDNPEGIHRNRSPRCKFFLRNQEVNVRIPEPSGPPSDNLQRLEHLQPISSNPERATTSLPATAPARQLPTTEGTGHIAGGRAVRSPGAAGLQSDETVATTTVQAKYPHYATKSARLESFKGWPQSLTQTPDIMAEAGFYFAGFGDCCRCFQCGVGLRHWDIDDNPWVEHCRWSSSCLYLKLKKGEEFVRLVQMAVTVTQEAPETLINRQLNGRSTLEEERSESGTPAPPQLSEVNTLLLTDAAQSVLEMGYQPKIIKQAIGKILQTKGRTGITAVALMEEVMELEEKEKQENATQNNSNNTVVLKSGGSTDQEEITLLVSDFSANTEGETNATASTDDSTLDSKAIKSENERLREQTLCKICLVNSICVVFLPCGHLVTCVDCAPAMRKCPMCRQIVKGTVRTYMG